jgi:hypothetical protein
VRRRSTHDDDGSGAVLQGPGQTALEGGGIEMDAGTAPLLQRSAQKCMQPLIDLQADAADP